MIIKQIKVGNMQEFTYLIGCDITKIACVIDPGGETAKIYNMALENGLDIKYIFNTHYHADHTCGNKDLKKLTGAKILIHKNDSEKLIQFINIVKIGCMKFDLSPRADIIIDTEKYFDVGSIKFELFHTPGHSEGGMCFLSDGNLFTGDTLFVGDSGRTDLPGGNRKKLGESLRFLMNNLPDTTIVWPGHDFGIAFRSTLGWEMYNNKNAIEYGFTKDLS